MRRALERLPGVIGVGADHHKDAVWVKYREGEVALQEIASAIRREVIFPRIRRALAELGHLFGRRKRPL